MFLDKLIVKTPYKIIRTVPFKKGLNLVVDETTKSSQETGNSVGKTTLLRVIDYCFGSEGEDIYTDNEFKNRNDVVYNFLYENEVSFELHLTFESNTHILERGFTKPSLFRINGIDYDTLKEYKLHLETRYFRITESKPSLRNVMPKFIRKDVHTMSHTLNYLHTTTRSDQYETLFLFLFGFKDQTLLVQRSNKVWELKKVKKRLTALKSGRSLGSSKQILKIIERDIKEAEKKLNTFDVDEEYKVELNKLNAVNAAISQKSVEVSNYDLKLSLLKNTITDLKQNQTKVVSQTVEEIYAEAKRLIPNIQKEFKDILDFHEKMLQNKIAFVQQDYNNTAATLQNVRKQLDSLLTQEAALLRSVTQKNSFAQIEQARRELNLLYQRKGEVKGLIDMIEEEEGKEQTLNEELAIINEKVDKELTDFENNITSFNYYFSDFSKELYNEEYVLSHDVKRDSDSISFSIDNLEGNEGGGKKKGQVAAFDLAYISFLNEKELEHLPRFVMHDSVEDVHANQLATLFNLANQINGQYVVSVLRDKLGFLDEAQLTKDLILSLSQDNKFFTI